MSMKYHILYTVYKTAAEAMEALGHGKDNSGCARQCVISAVQCMETAFEHYDDEVCLPDSWGKINPVPFNEE